MRPVRPTCPTLLLLALCCVIGAACSSSRPTRFYTLYGVAGEPAAAKPAETDVKPASGEATEKKPAAKKSKKEGS